MIFEQLSPRFPPLAVGLVASHGLTDLRSPEDLLPYAFAMTPLPGLLVTFAFLVASLFHFARDIGGEASLQLHVAWLLVGLSAGPDAAADVALLYMLLVHLPLHHSRVWAEGTWAARGSVVGAVVAGLAAGACVPVGGLTLTHLHQKLVVAHFLVDGHDNVW